LLLFLPRLIVVGVRGYGFAWKTRAGAADDFLSCAAAQPYIGVNYGEVADNLPSPDATAGLLKSTSISKVRLYGADAGVIRALAGSNISVVVGVANGDIPGLAADPAAASRWLAANVLPFVPATAVSAVAVGNEVLESGDAALSAALLPWRLAAPRRGSGSPPSTRWPCWRGRSRPPRAPSARTRRRSCSRSWGSSARRPRRSW
jgi:hypothetical protein